MRLLSKNEVDVAKSSDKKREIDDAVRIASKIDSLRKTSAEEESRLSKFRAESLKKTQEEIDSLIKEKTNLEKDVESLKEERAKLLVPLDAEWEKVNARKSEIERIEQELGHRRIDVESKERDIKRLQSELSLEEGRIHDRREEVNKMSDQAQLEKSEAEVILREAQARNELSIIQCEARLNEVTRRENDLSYRIIDLENREDFVKKREIEQNQRDRQINDKYQTLQRTINRVKK